MKYAFLSALLLVLPAGLFAQTTSAPAGAVVTIESEAVELARGYAAAFSSLRQPPLTLAFQKAGSVFVLEDVKGLHASGGILVVEVGRGMMYLVSARDVLYITDGKALQPAKEPSAK
ncbi:hypothetical protein DB347_03305 [Opitutaceae bacterium EW11]|nr:hypothetical protein DB347_03305 [Opitutaceae bacterium EW11]